MAEPLRHRQTKGAATDMFDLKAAAPHLDSTYGLRKRQQNVALGSDCAVGGIERYNRYNWAGNETISSNDAKIEKSIFV
jgi:hypothetical protein